MENILKFAFPMAAFMWDCVDERFAENAFLGEKRAFFSKMWKWSKILNGFIKNKIDMKNMKVNIFLVFDI